MIINLNVNKQYQHSFTQFIYTFLLLNAFNRILFKTSHTFYNPLNHSDFYSHVNQFFNILIKEKQKNQTNSV